MIAIIDYGIGNLRSVHNAVSFISPQTKSIVTSDPDIVSKADKVIFPGQGAMPDCIKQLDKRGLKESVIEAAKQKAVLLQANQCNFIKTSYRTAQQCALFYKET